MRYGIGAFWDLWVFHVLKYVLISDDAEDVTRLNRFDILHWAHHFATHHSWSIENWKLCSFNVSKMVDNIGSYIRYSMKSWQSDVHVHPYIHISLYQYIHLFISLYIYKRRLSRRNNRLGDQWIRYLPDVRTQIAGFKSLLFAKACRISLPNNPWHLYSVFSSVNMQ